MRHPPVPIAVMGGSGLYSFMGDAEMVAVDTPYGAPSAPVAVGEVAGRPVAFLPRHGLQHEYPPHRINYRANLWALHSLGVQQILAPCAVGALAPKLGPGDLVVPDQLVDRTTGRVQTFVEEGAAHAPFAEPYCDRLRKVLLTSGPAIHDGGTMVVIEGPRFSTRAESQSYAGAGWSLVNMTGHPEAVLARELGICYATIALVTDRDAGVAGDRPVDQSTVFAVFNKHLETVREVLHGTIATLDESADCDCASWSEGLSLPFLAS
ncbi:MAG TPA: S-methyl-5'-thioadenosine phosphorylase [Nocardioidaceae bacterium]|nr:S-methyl-5'-thioadenosine phosphorylase [Nocardioidaceae bacterium]